jgi:hypothetical protein
MNDDLLCFPAIMIWYIQAALDIMGFSKAHKEDAFRVVAAILHLGNISFEQAGGAQVIRNFLVQNLFQRKISCRSQMEIV